MIPLEILSVNRQVNWKRVITREISRVATPWILTSWFFINQHIFSYIYLLIGIVMMSKSNGIHNIGHDKTANLVVFQTKDKFFAFLASFVSLVFFAYSIGVKFFYR